MRNSLVIFKKQIKDTFKNKMILIQFVLYPVMTLVMENAIHIDGMPELFFTKLFSVMYIGMAPLTCVASIIAEEKEKDTLRVLLMANVKSWQYLVGVGAYVWIICMLGAGAMATGYRESDIFTYLCFMGLGFFISIIAGACIGLISKNQMSATSLAMPVMLILAFLPMLAMFNERIAKIARFSYSQQIKICLDNMSMKLLWPENYGIIAANIVILLVVFIVLFRKRELA